MQAHEEWKQIKQFPQYYISNKGRVKSKVRRKETILKLATTDRGYKMVRLYNRALEQPPKHKNLRVHRLVAEYFIENFSAEKEVHHINGNRADNRAENLQCLTRFQHMEQHRKEKEAAESEAANAETN